MNLSLKKTSSRAEYRVGDESGHDFVIHTSLDEEWGWRATATISTFGKLTEEEAVCQLEGAAEYFLKKLKGE
jgi:hypothetical protein